MHFNPGFYHFRLYYCVQEKAGIPKVVYSPEGEWTKSKDSVIRKKKDLDSQCRK